MYIDCCVPWISNKEKFIEIINMLFKLGYQAAIINCNGIKEYKQLLASKFILRNPKSIEFPINITSILHYKAEGLPIPLIPMISIQPNNEHHLKQELGRIINYKTLVGVYSENKEILEVAAREGRVDTLHIHSSQVLTTLTKGMISLAKQNNCMLNFTLTPIIQERSFQKTRIMRQLYRIFSQAKPNTHDYILGSNTENKWILRGPKENLSLLVSLFDFSVLWAKHLISHNGEEMVLRFIKRDLDLFIEPGVEIIDKKTGVEEK